MKIHEYQAKELLAQFGVPVPKGRVARTPEEARAIAQELGGKVVVKAQVHAGGRGKAGGVAVVSSPDEAAQKAAALLNKSLVTHQTGPAGVPVRSVLVEEALQVQRELYVSIIVDGGAKTPVVIASEAGGMEIEEVAARTPEKILQAHVDPVIGLQPFVARRLAMGMHLDATQSRAFPGLLAGLYKAFQARDCSLVEINPLVVTADGRLIAADAKVNTDDNANFRQKGNAPLRDPEQEDPLERVASEKGIQYVHLSGDVGCMVNGAGLAMATMDVIQQSGGRPANFLDVGGAANEGQVTEAFKLIVSDPSVRKILVNVFGGILRCDIVARGIVEAYKQVEVKVPVVVRMTGTNAEEGRQILREAGLLAVFEDLADIPARLAQAK